MQTLTWNGAVADWNTDADWTPATSGDDVPKPGDIANIASGTVILTSDDAAADHLFENNQVRLGGSAGATLLLRNSLAIGRYFNVAIQGAATIEADGVRGFAASITGSPNDASTITLKADPGGNLVLLHGGSFNVADRTVDFEGNVTLERDAMVSGNIVNNGALSILSGRTTFATNGLSGTGTISIGGNAEFGIGGYQFGGANQTISFAGLGGTLDLAYDTPGNFTGTIRGFAPGDFIRFTTATSATLDTAAHTLTVDDSYSGNNYVFNNFYGEAGSLMVTQQSDGFDRISYADVAPRLDYQIDAGARAMRADVVHTMTVPGTTTPITGAGVKVGIISDSFNLNGQATADIANGYLPEDGVTVLREGSSGNDEGRAMAELIHQTAPGASLCFASAGFGVDDFASSVKALQAAGCTVIVDDIGLGGEPFFQLGSAAENAISDAIGSGVTYVSSAGNYGDAFYQHAFKGAQQTLPDGSSVQAMTFSNGTPYQSITAIGGLLDTIDLQWDAPFYGTGGVASDQPGSIVVKAFDATTNALVGTSTQVSQGGHPVAETELTLPYSSSNTTYDLAIYHADGTPVVSEIKYIITGVNKGASVGGRINDPDAGVGSGSVAGHQLVPGVIAVAAADVTNTSAFGRSPDYTQYFTSTGPGTLLFDADGNRYAEPVTVGSPDLAGPDGIETSVTGFTPFYGTSAAAPNVAGVAALLQQVRPGISPSAVASILAQSALPFSAEPDDVAGTGLVQADRAILLEEQTACYCAGTTILTDQGERRVETLAVGDLVVTASGTHRPIVWLGARRVNIARHPRPERVRPIRFVADALGDGLPRRDLIVSPEHALWFDGALVPAERLVNGATIRQEHRSTVDYFHVELESHDILLAEGVPAESYLDCDNRCGFDNAPGGVVALHVDWGARAASRPLASSGLAAELRARFADRAYAQGHAAALWAFDVEQRAHARATRTNVVRNPRAEGSRRGAVNGAGQLPTHWWADAPPGITIECLRQQGEDSLPSIDLRFSGRTLTAGSCRIYPQPGVAATACAGQDWSFSCYLRRTRGSFAGVDGVSLSIDEYGKSGAYIAGQGYAQPFPTTDDVALQRFSATRRLTARETIGMGGYVRLDLAAGEPIDVTLRIAGPQIEQGDYASELILPPPGESGASTRVGPGTRYAPEKTGRNRRIIGV